MILVWPLAGPEAWHEAAGVPGRVADRRCDDAVERPGATASPTPAAMITTTAAMTETAQRRRRRFPAAVPAAPTGWTGLPVSSVSVGAKAATGADGLDGQRLGATLAAAARIEAGSQSARSAADG